MANVDDFFEKTVEVLIPFWGPFYAVYYIIRVLIREIRGEKQ